MEFKYHRSPRESEFRLINVYWRREFGFFRPTWYHNVPERTVIRIKLFGTSRKTFVLVSCVIDGVIQARSKLWLRLPSVNAVVLSEPANNGEKSLSPEVKAKATCTRRIQIWCADSHTLSFFDKFRFLQYCKRLRWEVLANSQNFIRFLWRPRCLDRAQVNEGQNLSFDLRP